MTVVLFSEEMLLRVWRYLSWGQNNYHDDDGGDDGDGNCAAVLDRDSVHGLLVAELEMEDGGSSYDHLM